MISTGTNDFSMEKLAQILQIEKQKVFRLSDFYDKFQ
jgi:hypothetical protein